MGPSIYSFTVTMSITSSCFALSVVYLVFDWVLHSLQKPREIEQSCTFTYQVNAAFHTVPKKHFYLYSLNVTFITRVTNSDYVS